MMVKRIFVAEETLSTPLSMKLKYDQVEKQLSVKESRPPIGGVLSFQYLVFMLKNTNKHRTMRSHEFPMRNKEHPSKFPILEMHNLRSGCFSYPGETSPIYEPCDLRVPMLYPKYFELG